MKSQEIVEKDKKLRIAVDLEGHVRDQFLAIQKLLGLKSYTDVFRFLITNYHRQTNKDGVFAEK